MTTDFQSISREADRCERDESINTLLLLGPSPAGLSATGESDVRNYYDMIAARQELDLRPQLERIDALLLRSAGVDPARVSFAFRPLWQLSAAEQAAVALQKAQASQIYAGLNLWPAATMAGLVQAQLAEDGTYPNADGVFPTAPPPTLDYDPNQPRDPDGRWTNGGGGAAAAIDPSKGLSVAAPSRGGTKVGHKPAPPGFWPWLLNEFNPIGTAYAQEAEDPEKDENRGLPEETIDPTARVRIARYYDMMGRLRAIDPKNLQLGGWTLPESDFVPSEQNIADITRAAEDAAIKRVQDFVRPNGNWIGLPGTGKSIRVMPEGGGLAQAEKDFDYLSAGGVRSAIENGATLARLPGNAGTVVLRPTTSTPDSPAIEVYVRNVRDLKVHY